MTIYKLTAIALILSLSAGCRSKADKKPTPPPPLKDTVAQAADNGPYLPKSHLRDTTVIKGSVILFLLPNQERYDELQKTSEGTGEADSDFGVGINNTLDSLKKIPDYKEIEGLTTSNRYILIKDCEGGPKLIDRDTVDYGVIMTAPGMKINETYNSVHSGDYLGSIDAYFFGRGN